MFLEMTMSAETSSTQSYYSPTLRESSVARKVRVVSSSGAYQESHGATIKELLGMRDGVRVCSRLHAVVHEFRLAHQLGSANAANRDEIIREYSVEKAPSDQVPAITRLSTPATYAELRHGGRLLSPYPPLSSKEVTALCEEIRAALVWKSVI